MKPEERDAVIEECAKVCERQTTDPDSAGEHAWDVACVCCAGAIRALTAQSPAGVPPGPPWLAEARLWKALGQWTATIAQGGVHAELAPPQYVLDAVAALAAGVPTTEPVAPAYKSEAIELLAGWLHKWPGGAPNEAWSALSEAKVEMELLVIDYQKAAALQAPVEPVAQEPVAYRIAFGRPCAGDVEFIEWRDLDIDERMEDRLAKLKAQGHSVQPLYASPISLPVEGSREHCLHCQSPSTCDAVGHCRHGFNTRVVTRG